MKLTNNCYAILGLGYITPWTVNSGFIVGEDTTIIIDAGPNYLSAQTILGYAQSAKPVNQIIVINTEKHLDHVAGNCLFAEKGFEIYGHPGIQRGKDDLSGDIAEFNESIIYRARKSANEEKIFYENTRIVNPNFHVNDGDIINLGKNKNVSVIYTPGHTQTNISIFSAEDKVLYCGDCIINGYLPNLEDGLKDDWVTWLKSLDKISAMNIEHIVPGHGKVISGPNVKLQITRMREILHEAIRNNKPPTK